MMAAFAYLGHVEAQISPPPPRGVPTHLLAQIRVFSCESRLWGCELVDVLVEDRISKSTS